MHWYIVLLEYAKVLLSWPVVVGVLGLVVLLHRGNSLRQFLEKLCCLRVAGAVEMTTQLPSPANEGLTGQEKMAIDAWAHASVNLVQAEESNAQLRELVQTWQSNAAYWEFQYLYLFLVPKTRLILGVLAAHPATIEQFYAEWPSWNVGDDKERDAVLAALTNTNLIGRQGDQLVVTDKGRAFIQFWRRPA